MRVFEKIISVILFAIEVFQEKKLTVIEAYRTSADGEEIVFLSVYGKKENTIFPWLIFHRKSFDDALDDVVDVPSPTVRGVNLR